MDAVVVRLLAALEEAIDIAGAELEHDGCLAKYGEPCRMQPDGGVNEDTESGLCSVCDMQDRLASISEVYWAHKKKAGL